MFGNNKPFGSASTFGSTSFGGTTAPFGQTNTFGAKPATSNVFGGSPFGATVPQTSGLFGGAAATTTGTGLFGQPSTAFGQPASTSGGSFAFGTTPTTGGSLFGTNASSTQQNTSLFGGSNTSAFGTPRPAFGGFGGTSTGTSLFGSQNTTSGLFGSSGGFTQATNGTTIKFVPVTSTDTMMKGGVSQNINTRHQCITCMKEYENKSLEELRLEDYAANRKGPQAGSTLGGGFGSTVQGGLFGAPAASTSAFSFGTTQAKTPFGTTAGTNTFGSTGGGLFGQTTQSQNTGLFGKPGGFGAATTTSSGFNFGASSNTSLFGQNTQQKPLFGQPTQNTGLFGQTTTTQPSTGFGMGTSFGGFGATSQPSTGLFGKPTGFGTTNTTTTNTFSFGTSSAGGSTGLFGAKPATTFGTGSAFGNTSAPFGSFGTNTGTTTSLFGQTKPNTLGFGSTGSTFGTGLNPGFGTTPFSNTGLTTSTNMFGSSFANKPTGFGFGNTGAGFGGFGQTTGTGSTFNFGGTPGVGNMNDPNAAAAWQQQQLQAKQIYAFTATPFGDNPLFRNPLKDSKRREEQLKPTNPAAQKAVLASSQYKVSPLPVTKIKPKPITPNGKVSLFDGLEDEEPSLGNETFVPKRNFKKLVIKPNSLQNNSSISISENELPISPPFTYSPDTKLPKSSLKKHPPTAGESPPPSPLTVAISDRHSESTAVKQIEVSSHSDSSFSPTPLLDSNSSPDDTIKELHTKNYPVKKRNEVNNNEYNSPLFKEDNDVQYHCPVYLKRPGYYTIPPLNKLSSFVDENGDCFVENFTIGHNKYGNVMFPGTINIANLNLDEIVHFQPKEITIYPDDEIKPPVGEGLNRKAKVTLDGVWPLDKTTHLPIKDPDRLAVIGYLEKIKKSTKHFNGKLIDYIPETGSWIFEVEHFSKYGLQDSDDENENVNETKVKVPEQQRKTLQVHQDLSFPPNQDKIPLNKKQKRDNNDDDEMQDIDGIPPDMIFPPLQQYLESKLDADRFHVLKRSFFMDENEDTKNEMDVPESMPSLAIDNLIKPKLKFGKTLSAHDFPDYSRSTVFSDSSQVPQSPKFRFSKQSVSKMTLPSRGFVPVTKQVPNRKFILKPLCQSILHNKDKLIADAGLFMNRSFRVGWGPGWSFLHFHVTSNHSNLIVNSTPVFGNFSQLNKPVSSTSLDLSKLETLFNAHEDDTIKSNLIKSLKVQLQHSVSDVEDGSPIFIPKPGVDALHAHAKLMEVQLMNMDVGHADKSFIKQCYHVWELCVALWGEIPDFELTQNSTDYAMQMSRREALSSWLIEVCREKVQSEINNNGYSPDGYLLSILSHMSIRQIDKAVHLAQEHHDHVLAKLLAQVEGNYFVRKFVLQQLIEWKNNQAYKKINHHRLKIYALIGGLLFWECNLTNINCCADFDWRRSLALHLWYCCYPTSTINDAITMFEKSFQCDDPASQYSRPPYPPYMDDIINDSKDSSSDDPVLYDTCFHLLKLYCDRTYRLDKLLMPETSTPATLDYRLSWFLHQALQAIEYRHLPPHLSTTLHLNFAAQLEAMGLWQWAIFVVLHLPLAEMRTSFVKDLLLRNLSVEENEKMELFLRDELCIPLDWIYEAKAVRAHSFGRVADEAWYLLKAGSYSKSHDIIINSLAAEAIINEDYDYLSKFLNELAPVEKSSKILNWASGGKVFLDYIYISQMVDRVVKGEISAYDVEKLQPEVISLCTRLSSLYCPTAKNRLCQSEMAKKTATLFRAVLTLIEAKNGNAASLHTLAPHIKNLPMPEDYAIQELRTLACNYMLAVTSE